MVQFKPCVQIEVFFLFLCCPWVALAALLVSYANGVNDPFQFQSSSVILRTINCFSPFLYSCGFGNQIHIIFNERQSNKENHKQFSLYFPGLGPCAWFTVCEFRFTLISRLICSSQTKNISEDHNQTKPIFKSNKKIPSGRAMAFHLSVKKSSISAQQKTSNPSLQCSSREVGFDSSSLLLPTINQGKKRICFGIF